jgi:radical SAM superfamily enzyme YgiQ (UPF0313 family)
MRYEGDIYRPPSEWQSYILQVTIGCSHNACTFCGMFKDKQYRVRSLDEIFEDIDMAKQQLGSVHQVFLCDGDAISLGTKDLLRILYKLKCTFPELEEIATYAGPKSTLKKSGEELRVLHDAGLTKAYLGVESGDDRVLEETCKGVDASQMLAAGQSLVEAGIELYAIILLGLAGKERSAENAVATAEIINKMKPAHLTAMTYTPVPGTKMYRDIEAGKFHVLDSRESLIETRTLVENLSVENLHFLSNHASNYVSIDAEFPKEKEAVLNTLDAAIHQEIPVRREEYRGL